MLNITVLSLSIASSFSQSPFLQISSSNKPSFTIFKDINAANFFSSFLITRNFNSHSIIYGSSFNKFITSQPVLSFDQKITPTSAENATFYGDTIPHEKNNIFYNKNITEIINCKFMSITDNTQEQMIPDVGLCIYTTKNTTIQNCYFFAIMSYRSGSAVLFDSTNNNIVNTKVTNCIFKSITQNLINFGSNFVTGGAVSHGRSIVDSGSMYGAYVDTSETENCCFEKVRLTGQQFNGRQLGVLTYLSKTIKSTNLNFTDSEVDASTQQYGDICVYLQQEMKSAVFSFLNFFDNLFTNYGVFSIMLHSQTDQKLTLTNSNFINNSNLDDERYPLMGFEYRTSETTTLNISYIQCNNDLPFLGLSENNNNNTRPIKIKLTNSIFTSSQENISDGNELINITLDQPDSNQYSITNFDVDVENNIKSYFGYIQTSYFSASESFSIPFVQDSPSVYDMSNGSPLTAGVLATIFGIISFIVFIFLLCVRRGSRKKVYEQVGNFNPKNEFDADSNLDNVDNQSVSSGGQLDDIEEGGEKEESREAKSKRKREKRKKRKNEDENDLAETNNNSNDIAQTQEDTILYQVGNNSGINEDSDKIDELN